ncbi:MAG TPA: Crp/Fnr family transcriptional regulator [Candidatus Acidoferrum sp.]|nr:Crp/Fnr family transcriptional regulator [Candidatus Acidoferrum sp.]
MAQREDGASAAALEAVMPANANALQIVLAPIHSDGADLSSTLSSIFRGRFCQTLLQNRSPQKFEKGETLYDIDRNERLFFFIRSGVVKIGTVTETGEEVIFDVRKAGEVVGELSASSSPRIDRAVALELTEAVPVSYEEILETIQKNQPLLRDLIQLFCDSLLNAQEQVTSLAFRDTMQRLTKTLLDLAGQLGRPTGKRIEITAYLTQEELAQMVAARRERVSLGLGLLRRSGLIEYTAHGHLVVDPGALRDYRSKN